MMGTPRKRRKTARAFCCSYHGRMVSSTFLSIRDILVKPSALRWPAAWGSGRSAFRTAITGLLRETSVVRLLQARRDDSR